MPLPETLALTINIIFGVIFLIFILYGVLRGLFKQIIDLLALLVALIVASFLAQPLANGLPLVPASIDITEIAMIDTVIVTQINMLLWFMIIVFTVSIIIVIIRLIYLRKFTAPWPKVIDRVGGAMIACITPVLVGILITSVFVSPLFSNGKEIMSNTVLSPLVGVSTGIVDGIVDTIDPDGILQKIVNDEPFDENDTEAVYDMLISLGVPEEPAVVLSKLFTGIEPTEEEVLAIEQWIIREAKSKEDIEQLLRSLGVDEEKIQEILAEYNK